MALSPILKTRSLKNMPNVLVLILILLLGLPAVGIELGYNFGVLGQYQNHHSFADQQVYGYLRQLILQWSAFAFASISILLAFIQFRLLNDKVALILGLSILFSSSIESSYALLINSIAMTAERKNDLEAFIWAFANSGSGLILAFGLHHLIKYRNKVPLRTLDFKLLIILFILTGFSFIYYAAYIIEIPVMWFHHDWLRRPYEASYVLIYLAIILYFYPRAYRTEPYILTHSIFYMAIAQIIMAIHFMVLNHHIYDSGYFSGYFLKMISYFIPFCALLINYLYSYSSILKAQESLLKNQKKLDYYLSHDFLTQLLNRQEFEFLLEKNIANHARDNTRFSLLLIDLDNFKLVNDTMGHVCGDQLLLEFSKRLKTHIRKGDVLARVGGDEFTLMTGRIQSPTSARHMIKRLLEKLNQPYHINQKLLHISTSIGVAIYPEDGECEKRLFQNASIALNAVKNMGKNAYRFYTNDLTHQQYYEAEIEAHLRDAINNDELHLEYQPIYRLKDNQIAGAEVLLRWNNPALGEVSPETFIPIAENSGLIISLGDWVINKALKETIDWIKNCKGKLQFSINISPLQIRNSAFIFKLQRLLEEYHYPSDALEVEITESMMMPHTEDILHTLEEIHHLGIKISLDDFGKGYSSLARLRKIPVDHLKIDQLFIKDIQDNDSKVVTVDLIISLAKELNMKIIGEGIETEAQKRYLIEKGCDYGQGFLMSKPLLPEAFEALIRIEPR